MDTDALDAIVKGLTHNQRAALANLRGEPKVIDGRPLWSLHNTVVRDRKGLFTYVWAEYGRGARRYIYSLTEHGHVVAARMRERTS